MKKLLVILALGLFLCTNATMATEEVKFDIVYKNEVYEIRKYPERLVVQAINDKDSGTFRKLFNYISVEYVLSKNKNNSIKINNEIKKLHSPVHMLLLNI